MDFIDFNFEIVGSRDDGFDARVNSRTTGELATTIKLDRTVEDLLGLFTTSGYTPRSSAGTPDLRDLPSITDDVPVEPSSELGQLLYGFLFSSPEVNRAFGQAIASAEAREAGVRLKLTLNTRDPAVADLGRLPWELLHDASKYKYFSLRPDWPIVRYLEVPQAFEVQKTQPPLRILVVSSNPHGDLDLERERANLAEALGADPHVQIHFINDATIQEISRVLAEWRAEGRSFHVLHYMGHGDYVNGQGVLLLNREAGGADEVSASAFNTALQAAGGSIRLVFLNACNTAQSAAAAGEDPFSGVATALVFEGVPAVVAMQRPVPDLAAVVLAQRFYPSLARGLPVDAAISEGRRDMFYQNRTSMDWAIPVLFMRSPTGVIFDFGQGATPAPAPVVVDPVVEAPLEPPPAQRPSRRTWLPMALGAGGVAAAALAWFAWPRPTPPADVDLEFPVASAQVAMGESFVASLELQDAEGTRIDGDELARYEVAWSSNNDELVSITPQEVQPEATALTAEILAARAPSVPGQPVTITASLAGFDGMLESRDLTIGLSQRERDAFREAFRAAYARFQDPEATNSEVAAAYTALHEEWAWILAYLDDMPAFTDAERLEIEALNGRADTLQAADEALEGARDAGDATAPLNAREAAWAGYLNAWGEVRLSPGVQEARARLAEIEDIKSTSAWVTGMNVVGAPHAAGSRVHFETSWHTPTNGAVSDGLLLRWIGDGEPRDQEVGRSGGNRARTDSGSRYFTAQEEGLHAIEVYSRANPGVLLWREPVCVGTCPEMAGVATGTAIPTGEVNPGD